MTASLTSEQILALAPDPSSAKAGKGLASQRKWSNLGHNTQVVWGECQGSGKEPYRTQVDVAELSFRCSCPSRKFPCKHGLGLLLLHAGTESTVPELAPPDWVEEWIAKRKLKAERKEQLSATDGDAGDGQARKATAASARQQGERHKRIDKGLNDLDLWLRDLIRNGLASAQSQPHTYWETMAARMVDAQALGVARLIRDMAGIPVSGSGWHERLLEAIGLLQLLLDGYSRLDTLPAPLQADVRSLIGFTIKQEDLLGEPGLHDQWHIWGQRIDEEDRLQVQRIWLYGEQTGLTALILDFAHQGQPLNRSLMPGTCLEAELVFFPSAYPQRALLKQRLSAPQQLSMTSGYRSIDEMLTAYTVALACNPWLGRFPAQLENVIPVRHDAWILCDMNGQAIPLHPAFDHPLRLLALSGGHPVWLFGEWDGATLLPLAVHVDNRYVHL